jgi:hypothetical protein
MNDDPSYNGTRRDDREVSGLISTDPFDVALHDLLGHPGGAHTQPATVRAIDDYKHVTDFIVQTVKWDGGTTVFVTQVSAHGPKRTVLPPKVVATLLRQQDQVSKIVRRRHGQRLAEQLRAEGRMAVGFTPEMRTKAAATRRAKAAKRAARKAARA